MPVWSPFPLLVNRTFRLARRASCPNRCRQLAQLKAGRASTFFWPSAIAQHRRSRNDLHVGYASILVNRGPDNDVTFHMRFLRKSGIDRQGGGQKLRLLHLPANFHRTFRPYLRRGRRGNVGRTHNPGECARCGRRRLRCCVERRCDIFLAAAGSLRTHRMRIQSRVHHIGGHMRRVLLRGSAGPV